MPAAATSQIKHITNASTTPDCTVALTPSLPGGISVWRYYSDLSAPRCASNLTNFAQIMRRPQMMTMTTTRTMAIPPVLVSPLPLNCPLLVLCQQKATKLLLH